MREIFQMKTKLQLIRCAANEKRFRYTHFAGQKSSECEPTTRRNYRTFDAVRNYECASRKRDGRNKNA